MSRSPERITPPKWPLKFHRYFLKNEYLEEIEGDMEERFQNDLGTIFNQNSQALICLGYIKTFTSRPDEKSGRGSSIKSLWDVKTLFQNRSPESVKAQEL